MKLAIPAFFSLLVCATGQCDHYGVIETRLSGPPFAYYMGGTNNLVSPQNPTDWRKRSDIEMIVVEEDLTIEEMRFICQIPSLKVIQLGKSPEVMKLRPGVLAELIQAKGVEGLWLNVQSLTKDDTQVFLKKPPLRELTVHIGPDWDKVNSETPKPPPLEDEVGLRIAELESLEALRISPESKFTNAFLTKLSKLPKLSHLALSSLSFDEESLAIIGRMELESLEIALPSASALSFDGLRNSPIRELGVHDLNRKGSSSLTLTERAHASLLAMKNLENIYMIHRWTVEGENAPARMEALKKHLEANRSKNARKD
jgi:hypothetical protein